MHPLSFAASLLRNLRRRLGRIARLTHPWRHVRLTVHVDCLQYMGDIGREIAAKQPYFTATIPKFRIDPLPSPDGAIGTRCQNHQSSIALQGCAECFRLRHDVSQVPPFALLHYDGSSWLPEPAMPQGAAQ